MYIAVDKPIAEAVKLISDTGNAFAPTIILKGKGTILGNEKILKNRAKRKWQLSFGKVKIDYFFQGK